jgi:glutaredoxin
MHIFGDRDQTLFLEVVHMWGKKRKEATNNDLERIPFTFVQGKVPKEPLTLFALSTCGFCRRAIAFLDELGVEYRYVHMDKISREQQDVIRGYVKNKYKIAVSFPFLCVGDKDFLTGFIRKSWEKELSDD